MHGTECPNWKNSFPQDWKLLEENVMGEFGLNEVLKQFIGVDRADLFHPHGRTIVTQFSRDEETKSAAGVRLALDNSDDAARFFRPVRRRRWK